jgi:DNA helicase HerA-like ATPase
MNSFILVDEAHNIMEYEFAALNRLLLEGRAYGVSVILSSQTLSHFESNTVNYREQIRSWFIHKTANVRDRELESLGLRAERGCGPGLAHLRNFEFAYGDDSGSVRLVRGKPFFEVYAQMSPTEQSW